MFQRLNALNAKNVCNKNGIYRVTFVVMEKKNILFFDGVCNLCNASIDYLIRNDKEGTLFYSPLQSEFAKNLLEPFSINPKDLDSLIFYSNGKVHTQSEGAIRAFSSLGRWRKSANLLLWIPAFLRNGVYRFIAKNRYKWFGSKSTCRLPTHEEQKQFL